MRTETLRCALLSYPTRLTLADDAMANTPRSWVQLAKTGTFVSERYGPFEIARNDLREMVRNFQRVTPKAPTQLVIDYDHLSMDPQKPGDGKAAGWIQQVELRNQDDELWGLVEWTAEAARHIKAGEYRFISPSFRHNHVDKASGTNIGTTLLAAAVTNHPFLEGMEAVTLHTDDALGDPASTSNHFAFRRGYLALRDDTPQRNARVSMDPASKIGQRVRVKAGEEIVPEDVGVVFEIVAHVGVGDDMFCALRDITTTRETKWYRISDLEVAPAADEVNPMTEESPMLFADKVRQRAAERGLRLADAMNEIAVEEPALAETYRRAFGGGPSSEPASLPVASVPINAGETFTARALRFAQQERIDLRDAVKRVALGAPELVAEEMRLRGHLV